MPTATIEPELLVQLVRGAPYAAPYLRETIDWIERSAQSDPDGMSAAQRLVEDYAAGAGPGARELAERLADARHALAVVRQDHYAVLAAGQAPPAIGVTRRAHVLRVAVAAGRARVSAGTDGAVTVATPPGRVTYRPVEAEEAHRIRITARRSQEAAQKRAAAVRDLLSRHVRMADWSAPEPEGVTVETTGGRVSVTWWSADPIAPVSPWVQGGERELCEALLQHRGYAVRLASDGAVEVLE